MTHINAIPFHYKGYSFRSKLEARWAAFFDVMGYEWVYEPEAYQLEDGQFYIPDFVLFPSDCMKTHIEVKPNSPTEEEWHKARLLSKLLDAKVIMCVGMPDAAVYTYAMYDKERNEHLDKYDYELVFVAKPYKYSPFYYSPGWAGEGEGEIILEMSRGKYLKAIYAARSLKYEYKRE